MKLNIFLSKVLYKIMSINRNKYNRSFPSYENIDEVRNIFYGDRSDIKQRLDIYFPDNEQKNPVVVHIHGGGWTLGDKDDNIGYYKYLASKGYTVVAINYPLAPKYAHPNQEKKVFEAISWIKNNIEKYHGNAKKIFLSGDSAGAHLAATVANVCTNSDAARLFETEPPVDSDDIAGMILFYGAFDFLSIKETKFPLINVSCESFLGTTDVEHNRDLMISASPIYYVNKKFPKTILISGKIDGLHETQSLQFADYLEKNNIKYETLFFDKSRKDAVHGFLIDYKRECTKESMQRILEFMKNDN